MDKISKLNILLKLLHVIDFVILNYGVHVQHDVSVFQDLTTISHFEQIVKFPNHFCKKKILKQQFHLSHRRYYMYLNIFFFRFLVVSSKRPVSTAGYVDNNQVL